MMMMMMMMMMTTTTLFQYSRVSTWYYLHYLGYNKGYNWRTHVSSCKSVDMRTDIEKYEEGFFSVVKIIEKGLSITNASVKNRSKTIVKITIE